VNQELNFNSSDNNYVIKGGCDLFTTKPISSDRKLFKTIDKHFQQIMDDNQLSRSIERERQNSIASLYGSSAGSTGGNQYGTWNRRDSSSIHERERRYSSNLTMSTSVNNVKTSFDDESPFGPLKEVTTRKTFAYLIAVLNTTYPDHDFTNLQPSTENFHRINNAEDLIHKFNNLMISLGKKEDLLNWIWDTINVYMDVVPSKSSSPFLGAQDATSGGHNSRKNSFNNSNPRNGNDTTSNSNQWDCCKIYQFQPSDESILEDLNYPYQTMWSNYWFIYNKKKKRVAFLYLTAINKLHYSMVNNRENENNKDNNQKNIISNGEDEEVWDEAYDNDDDDVIMDDEDNDVIGGIEI